MTADRPRGRRSRATAIPAVVVLGLFGFLGLFGLLGCSGPPAATSRASEPTASGAQATASPPAALAQPAVMSRSEPTEVRVPAIGIKSALIPLGLATNGTLEVPPSGSPAGWFTGAPTPGERGPAIIVGHVDWKGQEGVFYRLHSLKPGSQIQVSRADGTVAVFKVSAVRHYDKDHFPTQLVYGNLDRSGLRLITCGGSFDRRTHSYEDNIVAFADLVPAAGQR